MEFFKRKKTYESKKKEYVQNLFQNIINEPPTTKKALDKELMLSLRPITSGEEKYLKIEEIRKSNPKMPIKQVIALYEGEKNNIDSFPSAKKMRRLTNVDALEKDLPILTKKADTEEMNLMKKMEEFHIDNLLPFKQKHEYSDPHGNISFKNIKSDLKREIVKTTMTATLTPDIDIDSVLKSNNSVRYLSAIDFVEEGKQNILDSMRSTLENHREEILNGKNIMSPRNPISTLSFYEPEVNQNFRSFNTKPKNPSGKTQSNVIKRNPDRSSIDKSTLNTSLFSSKSTKVPVINISKVYDTSMNAKSIDHEETLNLSKQKASTINQGSFLKFEASTQKHETSTCDAFSTFFSTNKRKMFPSLKDSERSYAMENMMKGLKSEREKKKKFFEKEAMRTVVEGEKTDIREMASNFDKKLEEQAKKKAASRSNKKVDDNDEYIENINKKYEKRCKSIEMKEENSLLSILRLSKNKNKIMNHDVFPSLSTAINLISIDQEMVELDRLTLGLSMLNLYSNAHSNIEELHKFNKRKGKYTGIFIDDQDPDEENKLIVGENSQIKKQFNTIKRREKVEMYFDIKDVDAYLRRSYNITNKND